MKTWRELLEVLDACEATPKDASVVFWFDEPWPEEGLEPRFKRALLALSRAPSTSRLPLDPQPSTNSPS